MAQLSEDQVDEIREAFRMFDKDESGSISKEEIATVMRKLGQNPTRQEVQAMMDEHDKDGSGQIEFSEFVDMCSRRGLNSQEDEEESLRQAFKVFDRDNNGYITADELRHTMKNLGERMTDEEVEQMISEADVNRDGRVEYSEFCKIMSAKR